MKVKNILIFILSFYSVFSVTQGAIENPLDKLKGKLIELKSKTVELKTGLSHVSEKLGNLKKKLEQLLSGPHLGPKFDKSILEKYATDEKSPAVEGVYPGGYGYKTGNLSELKKITEWINQEAKKTDLNVTVKVPEFIGISSQEVKKYLKTRGLDIEQAWTSFKTSIQDEKDIFEKKTLNEKAEKALTLIQGRITTIFNGDATFFQAGLVSTFLSENKEALLMVRSTGKEDTETLANAGGNESVAAVKPILQDISIAMGVVVASYFSKKSFGQRLLSANNLQEARQIFQEEPFIPVLIQKMSGERMGGVVIDEKKKVSALTEKEKLKQFKSIEFKKSREIPVSGVMFTQEAEGKTPGVVHIQAAYGHNEGVVNSLVPVDTYYVGPSRLVHKVIRKKPNRLVSYSLTLEAKKAGVSSLKFVNNPSFMINAQTLTKNYVDMLCLIAREIERYYGKPMDVEYVVDKEKREIALVQARPIVYKQTAKPSYIKDVSKIEGPLYKGTAIGAGGGSLRVIDGQKALFIVEKELPTALNNYLSRKDKERIQCVVTGKMAPATSHEATTFRGRGIPVMYSANFAEIAGLTPTPDKPIVVDVQRGIIAHTSESSLQKNIVDDSWFSHPIPMQLSLWHDVEINNEMLKWYEPKKVKEIKKEAEDSDKILKDSLETIKKGTNGTQEQVLFALGRILKIVDGYFKKNKLLMDDDSKKDFGFLMVHLYQVIFEISEVIKTITTERDLRLLYPVKFLESLLYQFSPDVLRSYSFAYVIKMQQEEQAAKEKVETKGSSEKIKDFYIRQLYKGIKVALHDDVEKKWKIFLDELRKKPLDEIQKFATKIVHLQKLDIFVPWLNYYFMKISESEVLKKFDEEYRNLNYYIKFFTEKRAFLETFDLTKWQDPEKFEKQLKLFIDNILTFFLGDQAAIRSGIVFDDINVSVKQAKVIVDEFVKSIHGDVFFDKYLDQKSNYGFQIGEKIAFQIKGELKDSLSLKSLFNLVQAKIKTDNVQSTIKAFFLKQEEKIYEACFANLGDDKLITELNKKKWLLLPVLFPFKKSAFDQEYAKMSSLSRIAILSLMKKLVEVFDQSIKSITGTQGYALDKKLSNFRTMLLLFFTLLEHWTYLSQDITNYPQFSKQLDSSSKFYIYKNDFPKFKVDFSSLKDDFDFFKKKFSQKKEMPDWFVHMYYFLIGIKSDKNYHMTSKMISEQEVKEGKEIEAKKDVPVMELDINFSGAAASIGEKKYLVSLEDEFTVYLNKDRVPEFNVSSLALVSQNSEVQICPVTYEENFTVIHQSLINLVMHFFKHEGLSEVKKPEFVEKIHQLIIKELVCGEGVYRTKPSLLGIDFEGNKIKLAYNWPLRSHSAFITLEYEKNTNPLLPEKLRKRRDDCIFSIFFMGDNEYPSRTPSVEIDKNRRWNFIATSIQKFNSIIKSNFAIFKLDQAGITFGWDLFKIDWKNIENMFALLSQEANYSTHLGSNSCSIDRAIDGQKKINAFIDGLSPARVS